MKPRLLVIGIVTACLVLCINQAKAQTKPSPDLPKYEAGADFTSFTLNSGQTELGVGGRFSYNINKHVALEAAGYFFPGRCDTCFSGTTGRTTEGLFGVKAGKRFEKWGIFGKARPGLISFEKGFFDLVPVSSNPVVFRLDFHRQTNFALDVGGVLEFYPSRRIVVRFDGGDTIIHYGQHPFSTVSNDPVTGVLVPAQFTVPSFTRHNFQFIAGVGFRF
jgi:hypothetical protein